MSWLLKVFISLLLITGMLGETLEQPLAYQALAEEADAKPLEESVQVMNQFRTVSFERSTMHEEGKKRPIISGSQKVSQKSIVLIPQRYLRFRSILI